MIRIALLLEKKLIILKSNNVENVDSSKEVAFVKISEAKTRKKKTFSTKASLEGQCHSVTNC